MKSSHLNVHLPSRGTVYLLCVAALCCVTARADQFDIVFVPTSAVTIVGSTVPFIPASGSFSTNGICNLCQDTAPGMETDIPTFEVSFGGVDAFDLNDPLLLANITYDPAANTLVASLTNFGSEVLQLSANGTFKMDFDGTVFENGTFSVSAVPEPGSMLMLSSVLAALGWGLWRRKRRITL